MSARAQKGTTARLLVWCYGCGVLGWFDSDRELWGRLARCPNCGGCTDGRVVAAA